MDDPIEFKETVSSLCSIEHFYMPMNNSGLILIYAKQKYLKTLWSNPRKSKGIDDVEEELKRMEEFRKAQVEVEQKKEKPILQKMFKVI